MEIEGNGTESWFGNIEVGVKYQFLTSDEHEAILSAGVLSELGGTGAGRVGAESFSVIAGIAQRLYAFFGPMLAVLIPTGEYNAYVEVGSLQALLTTSYGRGLSVKIAIVAFLAVRYVAIPQHGGDDARFATTFLQRVRVDAVLILLALLCVSVFTHEIPARHSRHVMMNMDQGNMGE